MLFQFFYRHGKIHEGRLLLILIEQTWKQSNLNFSEKMAMTRKQCNSGSTFVPILFLRVLNQRPSNWPSFLKCPIVYSWPIWDRNQLTIQTPRIIFPSFSSVWSSRETTTESYPCVIVERFRETYATRVFPAYARKTTDTLDRVYTP